VANILCFYRDSYFVWSTAINCPVTYGMTESECVEWLSYQYNIPGFGYVAEAIARANRSGTNSDLLSLKDLTDYNRAGFDEEHISLDEIYRIYCCENRQYHKYNV
jgi:hypothetical protein